MKNSQYRVTIKIQLCHIEATKVINNIVGHNKNTRYFGGYSIVSSDEEMIEMLLISISYVYFCIIAKLSLVGLLYIFIQVMQHGKQDKPQL